MGGPQDHPEHHKRLRGGPRSDGSQYDAHMGNGLHHRQSARSRGQIQRARGHGLLVKPERKLLHREQSEYDSEPDRQLGEHL